MKRLLILFVLFASGLAPAREAPPKLQIDVDFFDNLAVVKPYCGSNWIDRFFADCKAHGVKRVTWRCFAQIANYPTKFNYTVDAVQTIRSAADERRFAGAFAAKVGVGRLPPGKTFGGIRQRVGGRAGARPSRRREYLFRAMVSSDALPAGAFLAAIDAASGAVFARSDEVRSFDMQRLELLFAADRPFDVGVFSTGAEDSIHVFVADALSLRALDTPNEELLVNGGMEEIDAFMEPTAWTQDGSCFVTLNGDVMAVPEKERKTRFPNIHGFNILNHPYRERTESLVRAAEDGNSLALAGQAAKKYGIELYAWYDPFDDGRKCLPPVKVWADKFMEAHPEYRCTDKDGRARWGLLCFACPEVRAHKAAVVRELLSFEGVTGVAFKTHYQHNLLWGWDSKVQTDCLYHPAILSRYHKRWGKPDDGAYSTFKLRQLHGEAVMGWLRELRPLFASSGKRLCMFQAPSPFLDRVNTCGWYLPPEKIVREKLCDDFLIEPRWCGDHVKRFAESAAVNRIVAACRASGVGVGFDFYYASVGRVPAIKDRGAFLVEQVTGLGCEDVDYIGLYEEICLHNVWPQIGQAAKALASAPPPTIRSGIPAAADGKLSLASCRDVTLDDGRGGVGSAVELVSGEDVWDGLYMSPTNAQATILFNQPVELSEVLLYSGHLSWVNKCPVEDCTIEGLRGGAWRPLGALVNANALKGNNQEVPNVCRFTQQTLEGVRVTVTRGGHPSCLVLRAIQGK